MTTTDQQTHPYPDLNVPLLSELIRWAVDEEAGEHEKWEALGFPRWDQRHWGERSLGRNNVCGTKACIAGNVIMQTEGFGLYFEPGDPIAYSVKPTITALGKNGRPVEILDPDADTTSVSDAARRKLGLTDDEANALFSGNNNLADVVGVALIAAQRRGVALDVPPSYIFLAAECRWTGVDSDGWLEAAFERGDD